MERINQNIYKWRKQRNISFWPAIVICCFISFNSCKKEERVKLFASDYFVLNNSSSAIEVHTSLHEAGGTGSSAIITFISAGSKRNLLSTEAAANTSIATVFHSIRIFQSGNECSIDEMNNVNWSEEKIGDEKMVYTLAVDSTAFQ